MVLKQDDPSLGQAVVASASSTGYIFATLVVCRRPSKVHLAAVAAREDFSHREIVRSGVVGHCSLLVVDRPRA